MSKDNSVASVKSNFLIKKGCESMCKDNVKNTKIFKKIFIVTFSMVAFVLMSFGCMSHAEVSSGKCGDNLTWSLDDTTGTLTISGTGAMYDYGEYSNKHPWGNDVKTVEIKEGVISIGDNAFHSCSKFESINIPDSVTNIGNNAFYFCTSLKSVNIPDSVTSIGDKAFGLCSSLESINIPDSVTSMGNDAFEFCKSLKSINIPDSVTNIGHNAFRLCSSLESINIPDSVTSIGDMVFESCKSLTNINLPGKVTSIGKMAFWGCSSLESINIPDSVTSIDIYAFGNCSSLKSIKIPDSVTNMGDKVFADSGLTYIELPVSFKGSETKLGIDVKTTLVVYTGSDGEIKVKDNSNETNKSDDANTTVEDKSSDASVGSTTDASETLSDTSSILDNASTGNSYFTKTADTIMPQTMFALTGLLMLALAGLWVSLKKQRS